jgi:hypothetical protein
MPYGYFNDENPIAITITTGVATALKIGDAVDDI